jgi:hypothetical protein
MNPDDWRAEKKLSNGRRRCRHIPTRCMFDIWIDEGQVRAVLRHGAAPSALFEEAKEWFRRFGKDQPDLL